MTLPTIIQFSKIKKQVPVDADTIHRCLLRIAQCYQIAAQRGIHCELPTVSFDLRGTTAGKAFYLRNHIQLNPILLNENKNAFIARTAGHEAAHLIAHHHFGNKIKGHGTEWQEVMRWLGQEASRCHQYDTKNSAIVKRTVEYRCDCNVPIFLSTKHHLLIQAKRRRLICNKCGKHPVLSVTNTSSVKVGVTSVVRPPSAAMIKYAQGLAQRNNIPLLPAVLESFVETHLFIEKHKAQPEPSLSIQSDMPTPKQTELAVKLAKTKKLVIGEEILNSKKALSLWIAQQLQPKNN